MNTYPKAGDIFPAKEAIALIPEIDLGPPIEVPEIPVEEFAENIPDEEREFLKSEILRLKKERNALILAHNYVRPEIQDLADFVGDSLALAQRGRDSDADVLVEPAVLFMNQILAVNKKPHQIVLAPSLKALCSLAAHAKPEKILEWRRQYPNGIVVSYVNTYIDVKAASDYCCASANAAAVIKYVIKTHKDAPVLFLPDVYLGFYAAKLLQKMGENLDRLWLMMGACHVHDMIRPYHVHKEMRNYPDAAVVVHPECGCTSACMRQVTLGMMPEEMMQFRSTQGMIKFVQESPQKEIIVATETGNLYPMSKAAPDKTLIAANPKAVCAFMKQSTLRNLYKSLRDMKYEITVPPALAKRAKKPIQKMLEIVS